MFHDDSFDVQPLLFPKHKTVLILQHLRSQRIDKASVFGAPGAEQFDAVEQALAFLLHAGLSPAWLGEANLLSVVTNSHLY